MCLQFVAIGGGEIGKVTVLAVIPDLLCWIELRCVCRKPFHLDILAITLEVLPDRTRLVHAPAVKDQNDLAAQMPSDTSQEAHDIISTDVVSLTLPIEPESTSQRCQGDRTDKRKSIVPLPLSLNGV